MKMSLLIYKSRVRVDATIRDNSRRDLDCAPKLRQSEFGHSSSNGERDVRRGGTKMGPSVGRIPAAGFGADENMPERKGAGERARSGAAAVVLVEAAGRKTTEAE